MSKSGRGETRRRSFSPYTESAEVDVAARGSPVSLGGFHQDLHVEGMFTAEGWQPECKEAVAFERDANE